jgi:hypothetical protein
MGIYEAWEDKLAVLEDDERYIERSTASKGSLKSSVVDVLLDPFDVARWSDG